MSKDHWDGEDECDVELDDSVIIAQCVEQRDFSDTANVPISCWPTWRSNDMAGTLFATITAMETRRDMGNIWLVGQYGTIWFYQVLYVP